MVYEKQEKNDVCWLSFETDSGKNIKASSVSINKINSYWSSLYKAGNTDLRNLTQEGNISKNMKSFNVSKQVNRSQGPFYNIPYCLCQGKNQRFVVSCD